MLPLKLRPPLRHGPVKDRGGGHGIRPDRANERWTAKRRVALVVSILKGETSVAEAARTHGLTVAEVDDWREKCLLGAKHRGCADVWGTQQAAYGLWQARKTCLPKVRRAVVGEAGCRNETGHVWSKSDMALTSYDVYDIFLG